MKIIYKKQFNSVYHCIYHLVLCTKYRRRIFNDGILAYMRETMKEIPSHDPEREILKINHDEDHIHLMLWIPPKMSVGKGVSVPKTNTARHLKQKFPFLKEVYWGTDSIWSDSYFVSTVGVNEEVVRKYIEQQGQADAGQYQLKLV